MGSDIPAVPEPARGGPQHIPRPPDARPGDPPAWKALAAGQPRPSLDDVRRALADAPTFGPESLRSAGRGASAVLAPLYEHDGDLWVVLTRRSWHLRAHRGEVSFPGGRHERGETLWETALREAWEEIDLDRSRVERLGELDPLSTVTSRSVIVPYVGALPGRPALTANPDEVDSILHVRIAELLEPGVYRQERWRWEGQERPIHFFELVGDTVWGATGSMLVDFLTRITVGVPRPRRRRRR